ncbi:MAG: L,D-transpeptidase, partial [Bacteroidota bacterium]
MKSEAGLFFTPIFGRDKESKKNISLPTNQNTFLIVRFVKKNILYIFLGLMALLALYYFWPESQLTPGQKIDKMVVNKEQRTLEVFFKGELLATYSISLGSNKWP